MSLLLKVVSSNKEHLAEIEQLDEEVVVATLNTWRNQANSGEIVCDEITKAAVAWPWEMVLERATGQVYGLRAGGVTSGILGMCALDLAGETMKGEPCIEIVFVVKGPMYHVNVPVSKVGTCLVVDAVRTSLMTEGLNGRARIPQALHALGGTSRRGPSALYQDLGFRLSERPEDGVEYEVSAYADDLEIDPERAKNLIERIRNGS